jgi:transcriptional regulator with XRE-family HTH domain
LANATPGEWLKRQREAEGLTQEQLAGQLNCSTITLRKIESEERRPSAQTIQQLTKIEGRAITIEQVIAFALE